MNKTNTLSSVVMISFLSLTIIPVLLFSETPFLSFAEEEIEDEILCRETYVLFHRYEDNDNICISESAAYWWQQWGIGEIIKYGLNHSSHTESQDNQTSTDNSLKLSRTNVAATIPLHKGYFDGDIVYFIITDSSEQNHADIITEQQGWQVEFSPALNDIPNIELSRAYIFSNGVKGDGIHGFQGEVFASTPNQLDEYSAFTKHIHVSWNADAIPYILNSEEAIFAAIAEGDVTLSELSVVLNMPQISWPDGEMKLRDEKIIDNETTFYDGQVTNIDKNSMTVTFVAHRGWGPDGRTIYYILTDGTPTESIERFGIPSVSSNLKLSESSHNEIFQFGNGIRSTSGVLGYQPPITTSAPGNLEYSPLCITSLVEWLDTEESQILASYDDLQAFEQDGFLNITQTDSENSGYVMNCPIINPFQ